MCSISFRLEPLLSVSYTHLDVYKRQGQINEGKVSTRLALAGWPAAGEELQIARDIEIAKLTGAKLHIQHISTCLLYTSRCV